MSLSTQPYKGARDFYPEDKRIQKYIFSKLRDVVESYGYLEYDAPIIEPTDLYLSKTSDEIVNEQTYSFTDRGDRKVTLRPEMTPTVSRMVAGRRQELAYPLRWYSIPDLWRYERPQAGRLRQHYQLNVDLFGVEGIEGDVEIIGVADAILKSFGATSKMYRIEISSRNVLNELAEKVGIKDKAAFIRLVDAKDKMSKSEFDKTLSKMVASKAMGEIASHVLNLKSYESLRSGLHFDSIDKVGEAMVMLEKRLSLNSTTNIVFNPCTARGFDYYNDIVFEIFDEHTDNNRSMFGGGRYDGLVGLFGVDPVPTVGFGMGDVTLQRFLELHQLLPELSPETDAVAITIGDNNFEAQKIITKMRQGGANIAVDLSNRKIDAQIRSAVKSGVPFVLFIGDEEIKNGVFKLRNLKRGEEHQLPAKQVVETLVARRK